MKFPLLPKLICLGLFAALLCGGANANLLPDGFHGWQPVHGAAVLAGAGHALEDVLQIKHAKSESEEQAWISPQIPIPDTAEVLRLSAWMKCNCVALDGNQQRSDPTYNASLCVQFFDRDGREMGAETPVLSVHHSVRRSWKFLEEQIIAPRGAASLRLQFCFRRHALGVAWAGDISLEKLAGPSAGPAGVARRASGPVLTGADASGLVPFFLDSGRFSQIFEPGQPISFHVKYRSILKKREAEIPAGAVLRYDVRDIHGRIIERGEKVLTGTAEDILVLKHPGKIASGVYHELQAKIHDGDTFLAEDTVSFGIIPSRPCDPASEPEIFELDGIDELAVRMGVRRRYLIGGNPPNWQLKKAAELKRKYGVKFYTNGLIVATSWQKKNLPARSNSFFKSDEAAFREELHKQLLRYKGIIDGVGLMGEMLPPKQGDPAAEKQAEDQVEVMRILKEEIQKVDPAMQAAAGGYFYPDFDLLLKKGLAKYADLIMLHRFSDPAVTEEELAKTQQVLNGLGKRRPAIWVDEAYCFGSAEEQVHQQYVNYLAYGVKIGDWHVYNFKFREYWKDKALSIYYPSKGNITLPEPALFSYNVMIENLSGLEFQEKNAALERAGVFCYVFRVKKTGKLRLAVWTRSDVKQRILQIGMAGNATLCDIRGRRIDMAPCNGGIAIGVTPRIQYIDLEDAGAVFSCDPSLAFSSGVDVVKDLRTGFSPCIPDKVLAGKSLSLLLPEGWRSSAADGTSFELMPEETVQLGRTCFGYVVLRNPSSGQYAGAFPVQMNVVPPLQMEITPVFSGTDRKIQVRITNCGPAQRAVITLENHFTKASRPESIRKEISLKGQGANTVLTYPAEVAIPSDEYPVRLMVTDCNGNLLGEKQVTISFFGVPRASGPHAFDGAVHEAFWRTVPMLKMDSELWLDANEMYSVGRVFAVPEQNDGTWKGADDFSVQLQQCWDEEHYYLRAVVKDAQHINDFRDLMIWSGDAIQFRLADASCKGAFSSFCIARNADNRIQVWRYRGNEFNKTGEVRTVPCRIERDELKRQTVYELVFPKKEVEPADFQAGNRLKITLVFLNRINPIGSNPMVMRFGYGIYGGGGEGDAIVTLVQ